MSVSNRIRTSQRVRNLLSTRALLVTATLAALSACARPQSAPTTYHFSGVSVMNAVLGQRIELIAQRSPTFRAAWQMVQASGVPVSIGTDTQLRGELPSWYRKHPNNWAGVTVAYGGPGQLKNAVVALRLDAMKDSPDAAAGISNAYMLELVDRILVHEIYGHLVPVVEARDMSKGCPDARERGEAQSCVEVREAVIAAELERYSTDDDVTAPAEARDSQPSRIPAHPLHKR